MSISYHIRSPRGRDLFTFEDEGLARVYLDKTPNSRLIKVIVTEEDITNTYDLRNAA